jgi:uncharacterized membrane protein
MQDDPRMRDQAARTYGLIASVVFFSSLGNVLLSKGMKDVGEIVDYSPPALFHVFSKAFMTATIWMGIASLLVFFVSHLLLLSWADFSFVQPVTAIGYAAVAVFSYFFLGESISPTRWIGVLFICGGVALVSGTGPRTAQEDGCD